MKASKRKGRTIRYDYYIAQQKHQELINEAAHSALVRKLRQQNRPANPLLVAITNLLPR